MRDALAAILLALSIKFLAERKVEVSARVCETCSVRYPPVIQHRVCKVCGDDTESMASRQADPLWKERVFQLLCERWDAEGRRIPKDPSLKKALRAADELLDTWREILELPVKK